MKEETKEKIWDIISNSSTLYPSKKKLLDAIEQVFTEAMPKRLMGEDIRACIWVELSNGNLVPASNQEMADALNKRLGIGE